MPTFTGDQLKKLSIAMFKTAGATDEEAEIVSEVLVATNLHGVDSHGVRQIPGYIRSMKGTGWGRILPGSPTKVVKDTPTTALWDTNGGFGFVAGKKAMETAIEKAMTYKFGMVGMFNSLNFKIGPDGKRMRGDDHIGALYYYSLMAAKHDMMGIVTCNTEAVMAAWGGSKRVIGVNPLSIAIPAGKDHYPIVLDMATSIVAEGHVAVMKTRGIPIPEEWLLDKDGNPTTDPNDLYKGGALLPFGTYKGFGLGVIIDAITGGLGSGCSLDARGYGHTYTAIDPSGFVSIEEFKARIDSLIDHVKASPVRPGFKGVFLPGELEFLEEEKRKREGIPVDEPVWQELVKTAKELGLDAEKIIE